jgi:hypothetical protein
MNSDLSRCKSIDHRSRKRYGTPTLVTDQTTDGSIDVLIIQRDQAICTAIELEFHSAYCWLGRTLKARWCCRRVLGPG